MTSKIFKSMISIAIAVLVACIVIITGVLYSYFGDVQRDLLKGELQLAASATEKLGISYLEELSYNRYRITWIDAEGKVLYDSHADVGTMGNHSDREEFFEAIEDGKGSSTRYSATLTEQSIYEATRLKDGSILRISTSHATALALVLGMVQPIAIIFAIAVILSACLTHYMARRIVEPLNRLNLEKPLQNDIYEELSPLLYRIHSQQEEIRYQMIILKQKQEEFDQITENMKEALVLLDNKERIVSINPAAKSLFEVEGDCFGKNILTIDRKQEMREAVELVKQKGVASFTQKKNGRDYDFKLSRIDGEAKSQGIVILVVDVTEKVNAEQNRRAFTANVSHELKTPLQSIIGSAELLENDIVKKEDVPRFVGHIRKEATRLVDLINDIIRLSQLDEMVEMPKEEVAFHDLATEVLETLQQEANKKEITLSLHGTHATMQGVRSLLFEMIYNLCDNAIKYNKQGGYVNVTIEENEDAIILCVKDSGIGIPPEHHEKVFERFYRVDKSHSKKSGGTGLGLSIVKHAVIYHQGVITMESKPEEGTIISVCFEKKQ